ncbi:hypothetical protein [Jeotgalicoccus psychrophilus]|uniref:hypothetical protein n=1 Tax=Jeotgalicoccus psychrophilus TaxID=157228 RepID=UPI00040AF3F7|nr:hypothetical protein [Jeotgalicoccus psychrophilus]
MSVKENENITSKEEPKEIKGIETLDLGTSGMVCDFETGICGPINEEKEDKK